RQLGLHGWFEGNAGNMTHAVGSLRPNERGLYDMHGNVWELCSDHFEEGYYKTSPSKDPPGPSQGVGRVMRGGAWGVYGSDWHCRSALRGSAVAERRHHTVRFRVVMSLK